MGKKPDDQPYESKFEKISAPTEPLSVRAAKREAQRENLRQAALAAGLREACGRASKILVKRFVKTGHVDEWPKRDRVRPRFLQTTADKKISSTRVALWVFDLQWHGGVRPMEAYRQTARDLSLTEKQVRDCVSRHRDELKHHRLLFTMQ